VPPKGYIIVYVKQDVFEKLMLLKIRLRRRSINDVIKELVEVYERLQEKN
jgi:predicted CopG family antitoxin